VLAGGNGIVTDGVQEMCLAQSRGSEDNQRIVAPVTGGDTAGSPVGKAIALNDRKGIERKRGVEVGRAEAASSVRGG
jgi:hypothetical protein